MSSGESRESFPQRIAELGYRGLSQAAFEKASAGFADLIKRKPVIYDEDVEELVDEAVAQTEPRVVFGSLFVQTGSTHEAEANLELIVDGRPIMQIGRGDGAIHAAFNALRSAAPHQASLVQFSVGAEGAGPEAVAAACVRLEENGRVVEGRGRDLDTIVASAKAFIDALNRLAAKSEPAVHLSPAFLTA